jgi:hypothetical protein
MILNIMANIFVRFNTCGLYIYAPLTFCLSLNSRKM